MWDIKILKLPELQTEIKFHPERRWRLDFGYTDLKIAVEYEGGTFGIGKACQLCKRRQPGRHSTGKGHEGDCEKYNEASLLGWIVLRANNNNINTGLLTEQLIKAYELRNSEDR